MKILLAGSLNNLLPIVRSLTETNNHVTIINNDRRECEKLADLTDHMVIYGEATQKEALTEAHIRNFDLVVALTDNDAVNLLICDLAKRLFGVRRSLASVTCPALEDILKRLGVDEALSYPEIAVRMTARPLIA